MKGILNSDFNRHKQLRDLYLTPLCILLDYTEELEPGQLRVEDMLKSPSTNSHAALYKFVSPLPGRNKNSRKQVLETRDDPADDEDMAASQNDLSDSDGDVVPLDSDQASTSGTQFASPKAPSKPKGKRQPAAAAGAAAKKRGGDDTVEKPKAKRTAKPRTKSGAQGEQDDESDSESNKGGCSGIDDGDDSETRKSSPPAKKFKTSSGPRAPRETKRTNKPKGIVMKYIVVIYCED